MESNNTHNTGNTHRTLLACGFFLHTGYIGAATVAAGLIQVLASEASGLALVVFGAILATASWRRARTVLDAGNRASVVNAHLRPICERRRRAAKQSGQPVKVMRAT